MTDEFITDHRFQGASDGECTYVTSVSREGSKYYCTERASAHADPRPADYHSGENFLSKHPHPFTPQGRSPELCDYRFDMGGTQVCGYPEQLHQWADYDRQMEENAAKAGWVPKEKRARRTDLVRAADVAQYERPPMPDAARRGPVVTLIDAPVDPLGTMAVIGGIYTGKVRRSKAEVTDDDRREMLEDMRKTVLDGPLESISFTFLIEGVGRDITHQMVRNRFSFFAQESLRFAVAEDWAQEVPLPPSLAALPQDAPAVGIWRKALNAAEDSYAALIGAGMPAEEARKLLPHAITTRLYWTVSLRTLLAEAGKRTCTQAQFDWRQIFGGVAKAFRDRATEGENHYQPGSDSWDAPVFEPFLDNWQFEAFADLLRPVCYQQGQCGFMAKFDRGCTIRPRVDNLAAENVPSSEWHRKDLHGIDAIDPAEWAADPSAARVTDA